MSTNFGLNNDGIVRVGRLKFDYVNRIIQSEWEWKEGENGEPDFTPQELQAIRDFEAYFDRQKAVKRAQLETLTKQMRAAQKAQKHEEVQALGEQIDALLLEL